MIINFFVVVLLIKLCYVYFSRGVGGRSSSDSNQLQNSTPVANSTTQQSQFSTNTGGGSNKRNDIINLSNENKITFLNEDLNNQNESTITAAVNHTTNSTLTSNTITTNNNKPIVRFSNNKSRFPRLQECAHFHYEISTIDIPKNFDAFIRVDSSFNDYDTPTTSECNFKQLSDDNDSSLFHIQVTSNDKKWILSRTYENFRYLDKHLHDCIFDRKFSCLDEIKKLDSQQFNKEQRKNYNTLFAQYLKRFCEIAFINPINCGPILNWFEVDNKGHRLYATDDSPINIPAVAAAVVKKRYVAQTLDEISLDVGNMISVIDMPPSEETMWWRGKKELEVK